MPNMEKFDCLTQCPLLPDNEDEPNARQREAAVRHHLAEHCLGQATGTLSAPNGVEMDVRACGSASMVAQWERESVLVRRAEA